MGRASPSSPSPRCPAAAGRRGLRRRRARRRRHCCSSRGSSCSSGRSRSRWPAAPTVTTSSSGRLFLSRGPRPAGAPPPLRCARRCRWSSPAPPAPADAFGILVPMFPSGLIGLWGARPRRRSRLAGTAADLRLRPRRPLASILGWRTRPTSTPPSTAPPTAATTVAVDFERYPDWARDVKEVTVLERDADGRGSPGRVPGRRARPEHPLRARVRLRRRAGGVLVAARRERQAAQPRRPVRLRGRR